MELYINIYNYIYMYVCMCVYIYIAAPRLCQGLRRQVHVVDVQSRGVPLLKLGAAVFHHCRIGLPRADESDDEAVVALLW